MIPCNSKEEANKIMAAAQPVLSRRDRQTDRQTDRELAEVFTDGHNAGNRRRRSSRRFKDGRGVGVVV